MCRNIPHPSDSQGFDRVETVKHKDQFGGDIYFQVRELDDKLCKEFLVISPRFPFKKWVLSTAGINLLGIFLNLHHQNSWLMSAIIFILFILLMLKLHRKVKEESLLVISSLGVQLTTKFATGRTQATFYQCHQVSDIVINEAITMQRVMFYLTILLRDNREDQTIRRLVPLYQQTWPSIQCLTEIYRGVHQVLDYPSNTR